MTSGNLNLVERIFSEAPFVGLLGVKLISYGRGWCETTVDILPTLQQQHGFAHAGVLTTIADHTCGGGASVVSEEKNVITVENKTSFLRPASGSVLICRAQVLRAGKNLIFVEAEVSVERNEERLVVAKTSSDGSPMRSSRKSVHERLSLRKASSNRRKTTAVGFQSPCITLAPATP